MGKRLLGLIAAISMAGVPAISLAQGAERASEQASEESALGGGTSFIPIAVILATIGGAIWLVVDDDDDDPISV